MRVKLSARLISFPETCACCSAPADSRLSAEAVRTSGVRVERETSRSWNIPYCTSCLAHISHWDSARTTASYTITSTFIGGVVWFFDKDWGVYIGIGCTAFLILIAIAFWWSSKSRSSRTCVTTSAAVKYIGWYGSVQTFEVASTRFAAELMFLNLSKVVSSNWNEIQHFLASQLAQPQVVAEAEEERDDSSPTNEQALSTERESEAQQSPQVDETRPTLQPAPESNSKCLVCGEQSSELAIRCRVCRTPYHQECWDYNGGCAIYGCLSYSATLRTKRIGSEHLSSLELAATPPSQNPDNEQPNPSSHRRAKKARLVAAALAVLLTTSTVTVLLVMDATTGSKKQAASAPTTTTQNAAVEKQNRRQVLSKIKEVLDKEPETQSIILNETLEVTIQDTFVSKAAAVTPLATRTLATIQKEAANAGATVIVSVFSAPYFKANRLSDLAESRAAEIRRLFPQSTVTPEPDSNVGKTRKEIIQGMVENLPKKERPRQKSALAKTWRPIQNRHLSLAVRLPPSPQSAP